MQKNIKDTELAYIAGFLDADGSLITQIVKDDSYKYGYTIRISINFYQKTNNYWILLWLKKLLVYGTIRKKKDGMSEYVIRSSDPVKTILLSLDKYILLKKSLLKLILKIIENKKNIKSKEDFIKVCELVDQTALKTYSKNRKITSLIVKQNIK